MKRKKITIISMLLTIGIVSIYGQDIEMNLLGVSSQSETQSEGITLREFIPEVSPQTKAMMRYDNSSDIRNTGHFMYTVPLIHWEDADFDFPISLTYSGTGFKPSESDNFTGKDWSLSCGGVICRKIVGMPDEWQSAGKSTEFQYDSQTTRKFSVGGMRQNPILIDEGSHSPGDLYVITETDEDGNPIMNYTDKHGHVVCVQNSVGRTHYVYDDYDNLVYVLTPEASQSALVEDTLNEQAYIYRYDLKNRCIGRKTPGSGWETYVLDKGDNIIFSQTSVQSEKEEWTCTIYDDFDRLVIEGIWRGELPEMDFENQSIRAKRDSLQACGYSVGGLDPQNLNLRNVYFYDNYKFLDSIQLRLLYTYMPNPEYGERYGSDDDLIRSKGLLTGAKIYATDGNGYDTEVIYYDDRDRPVQKRRITATEDRIVSFHKYDFVGNEIESLEIVSVKGKGQADSLHVQRTFDVQGRLLTERTKLNGVYVTSEYGYDDIGRLEMSVVTSGEVSDTTLRSYNVRGWQIGIQNDSWSAQMRYNDPVLSGSEASFTGNISEWEWTRGEHGDTKAYSFDYDNLSRITGSRLFRNGTQTGALSENGISYDSNGNILSLTRTGEDGSSVNNLTYTYNGNRLECLVDNGELSDIYAYDADGNMTFDGRTGMALTWNDLGLVEKVSLNGEDLVNYCYLADGTKVSALDGEGNGLLYLGSLIYRKHGESLTLESAGFAGGRFVVRETSPGVSGIVPMLHVTDHLGSVWAVVDGTTGAVVETNDYYPFGSRWNTTASVTDRTNRYRYNSKEEQSSLYPAYVRNAVSYIDYGARQYDPTIARWFAQDPLSEKYCSISPYAFCGNNPIRFEDVNGEDWYDKIIGYFVGGVTNVVPATGFVRDWYSPDNSADYNSALKRTDETAVVFGTGMLAVGTGSMAAGGAVAAAGIGVTASTAGVGVVVGGPVVAVGTEMAVVGAVTAATGGVLVMNSSKNKSDGYERGNTSTGNKNSKHANKKAKDSAKSKYEQAKAKYDELNNKTNKSPEDKSLLERLKREYKHWESKKNYTGENHSRNAKGNR